MQKYRNTIVVVILSLIFTTIFLHNTKSDFSLIFKKDLLAHDESSNSVVAANITRKFFPPMVRVNPLVSEQGNWMEGPFWQHIPPLFAYVPYIFFKIDGQISIEVKRLSYAVVVWLTGLLFIYGVYRFRKSLVTSIAATLSVIFWINTPFTHELITGYAFGVSDIVLAFTVVASFVAILWYLTGDRQARKKYANWKLVLLGLVVALPIMAKNILGAIPAATFFGLMFYDARDDKAARYRIALPFGAFLGFLLLYFLPLYFSSPATFKNEILLSFFHFRNLEGWERPIHWYVTNYLPQRYLGKWTFIYFLGLATAICTAYRIRKSGDRLDRILLYLSGGWFLWNLLAISAVTSKVPNFIYQTYLLSIFFIVYAICLAFNWQFSFDRFGKPIQYGLIAVLVIATLVTGYETTRFAQAFNAKRSAPYEYVSEHEKFYHTAEELRAMGVDTKDIVILRLSDNDCWARYPILFLTGAESKTLLEMSFGYDAYAIKAKYRNMYFLANKSDRISQEFPDVTELTNYTLYKFDLSKLSPGQTNDSVANFLGEHSDDIAQDILRIKKDKTSCQWLVPDPILNAP